MSRRDTLHDSTRRTLEKDGWIITDDPLILVLEKTLLKADLGAEKFLQQKRKIGGLRLKLKILILHPLLVHWKRQWGNFSFINGHWKNKSQNVSYS
jgi:hypothetical protein